MEQELPFYMIKPLWDQAKVQCCANCGKSFLVPELNVVYGYQHPNGWRIPKYLGRWWLYVRCRCGYDTSFVKLGIPKDHPPTFPPIS